MKFRTIIGLLIVLIGCSCIQKPSKSKWQIENGPNQHLGSKSGLRIDNDPNRGVSYTDSLGAKYNLRSIPITITNDSTIPIHIQIAFSIEYDYPTAYGDEKFNVFPFPKEFKPNDVTWDSVSYELGRSELRDLLDRGFETPYVLNETLEPSEKFVMSIGTLYPRPPKVCGVLPNELFAYSYRGIFPECDRFMKEDPSSNPQIALGLKLNFRESCIIIPCGQISYPDR